MMTQNLAALVRYRIEQADEALDAARILRTRCDYGTTVTITTEETAGQIEHASSFLTAIREECERIINSS